MLLYSKISQNGQDFSDGMSANYYLIMKNLSFLDSQELEDLYQKNPQEACQRECDSISSILFLLCQEVKETKKYSRFRKEVSNIYEPLKQSVNLLFTSNKTSQPMETEESILSCKSENQQSATQSEMLQNSLSSYLLEKPNTKTNSSPSQILPLISKKSSESEEKENKKKSNNIFESPQIETSLLNLNGSPAWSNKVTEETNKIQNQINLKSTPTNNQNSNFKNSDSSSFSNSTHRYAFQPKYKRENLNRGLRNLGLTCYFNSSLQSWYHLKPFREAVLNTNDCTPLFGKIKVLLVLTSKARLQTFFNEMQNDSEYVDSAHEGFVHEMFSLKKDQFKLNKRNDSGLLFQALFEELSGERDPHTIPYLKIFLGGSLLKTRKCKNCSCVKKIREPIKLLEVRDCDFTKDKMETYFQPRLETRTCTCTSQQLVFNCSYSATNLPQILAIRIHDTKNNYERARVLEEITLKESSATSSGKEESNDVKYKFVTGIFNTYKGEDGGHSVEISKHNGKYFEFNDLGLDDYFYIESVYRHPKVLYYQRV